MVDIGAVMRGAKVNRPHREGTAVGLSRLTNPGRVDWGHIIETAATIVDSYSTSVTLRQLFYRLVAAQVLPNTNSSYKTLSSKTAKARRAGNFPDLIDRGRKIHRRQAWSSPTEILTAARNGYRRDRTEGQDVSVYIGVEKAGMVVQLEAWFGDLGIPILALGGYSSQTYIKDIADDVSSFDRPAILLYAGDFDSSGEDIDRDFIHRGDCWDRVVRVALTVDQVHEHDLPINEGKETDSRSAAFVARHGSLMQVELDALPPEELQALYQAALGEFWNPTAHANALEREAADRKRLSRVLAAMGKDRG